MLCECGCGGQTRGGRFIPGHDQRLRVRLEATVGGIMNLRDLVDISESYAKRKCSLEDLGHLIERIFEDPRAKS